MLIKSAVRLMKSTFFFGEHGGWRNATGVVVDLSNEDILYNKIDGLLRPKAIAPTLVKLMSDKKLRHSYVPVPLRGKPFSTWNNYMANVRGMNPWRDVVDWVGGYPFEVAKPEEIFEFYKDRGFSLKKLKTCAGGHGCNEFVFINHKL